MSLYYAARNNNFGLAKKLLDNDANVNGLNHNGEPLEVACRHESLSVVDLLLHYGANTELKILTPRTPLHSACENGRLKVARLLLDAGANANARDNDNSTILHSACIDNNIEVAQLLIDKGADLESKGGFDWTPLHAACALNCDYRGIFQSQSANHGGHEVSYI